MTTGEQFTIERGDLGELIRVLQEAGYLTLGPTERDRAIVYEEIASVDELPIGWTEEQDGGTYRLKRRKDKAVFGFTVGPHSWKKYLFPSEQRLLTARKVDGKIEFEAEPADESKMAFIGVRACELAAIAVQDKVFSGGPFQDAIYGARRRNTFIVAVNCGQAAKTCFCTSMNTGPRAEKGFDLSLTEVLEKGRHYFVVEVGSEAGAEILAALPHQAAGSKEKKASKAVTKRAEKQMGRKLDTNGVRELLQRNLEHPQWDRVADRCLSCANCTMVCPTCFCSTVEEVTDLTGDHAERWRKWDSCFTVGFSYIAGGPVRSSVKSRYRQWLTHKLSTWHDQFDTSGCVGCGRCITWCPVAIDLTEEVEVIRKSERRVPPPHKEIL